MSEESEHYDNRLRQEGPKYSIYAPDTPQDALERNPNIEIGNTIEYNEDNQEGYKKYRVISDGAGGKTVKEIDNYDKREWRMKDGEEDEPDDLPELREDLPVEPHPIKGGKTRKRKSHRRKTHKRKTHKRKTHIRKSHKRKSRK